jgi:deoxyribonuclease V
MAAIVRVNRTYWPDQRQTPEEVTALQGRWAKQIAESPLPAPPTVVAGCDVHLRGDLGRATIAVLRFPSLEPIETVHGAAMITFPYIPGFLSWRELPAVAVALGKLTIRPDVLFADGHGLAHPRGFGLACHLGLLSGIPTLGCAKSILRGDHAPLAAERGARGPLVYRGKVVGMALRTKDRVKPLYISVGERITLDEATDLVLRCGIKHRLPEPSRFAHLSAQAWARGDDAPQAQLPLLPREE